MLLTLINLWKIYMTVDRLVRGNGHTLGIDYSAFQPHR